MTSAPPPAPPSPDPPAAAYTPPPGPPARPPLRRSRSDKVIGGVAGGLADYSGIDALLWRVGLVALALAGPGIPVYLLLWLLMPAGPVGDSSAVARAPRVTGPRSPVPGLTLAGLLIVIGSLVLLSRLTDWDVGPRIVLGTALLVVGLGLVAAAFSGGRTARGGLLTLGVLLSVALVAVAAEPWRAVEGGIDDVTYRPLTVDDVRPEYSLGVGDATLDLTDLDLAGLDGPVTTELHAGVGDVDVLVPRSADVRVRVNSGLGEVDVLGQGNAEGLVRGTGAAWSGDDRAEIELTINAGVGDVEVRRA
ncbi:PspC domain-containing protein [Geodermatophilus sp. URMC 61]|uniref:PspC domain-containing protein n=1 Tax=Geodermatophilus sp. URMC 61 TaxID=3423411 RepID=UPI00406C6C29